MLDFGREDGEAVRRGHEARPHEMPDGALLEFSGLGVLDSSASSIPTAPLRLYLGSSATSEPRTGVAGSATFFSALALYFSDKARQQPRVGEELKLQAFHLSRV